MTPPPPHPALTRRGHGISADGEFFIPTRVIFGRGVAGQVAELVAALVDVPDKRAVMVVTDPGVARSGLLAPVVEALECAAFTVVVFDHVEPNPRDVDCIEGAQIAEAHSVTAVVAIGGGSPIDTAKCIALLRTNGGHPRDWEDFGALQHDPLPIIAIPTTAGTGSEVSPSAVITDTERKKKMNLFDVRNFPRISLVDPDLTVSCPASVTAASGMDALSHAIDSLHCRLATPSSDALALEGARLVSAYLPVAYSTPADIEARSGVAQGSLAAGIAVGLTDVSGVHCMAESMGAIYGLPHGVCCAACIPPVMEYNLPTSADKYARLALAFGIDREGRGDEALAQLAIARVRSLNVTLGIPPMVELIRSEDLDLLATKAEQNTSNPSNPRAADRTVFRELFAAEMVRAEP
jgi:alcohol dehydrogenase